MSERDVYTEPEQRVLLRTADVYQTEADNGVAGYSDELLAVVANYRNGGAPEGFNAQSMVGKSKRGEVACRLFAVVNPDTHLVERAGFKTRGCLAMTACASVACEMLEGRMLEDALDITTEDIRNAVGGVPAGKSNTLTFAVEVIRALVGDYLMREGADVGATAGRRLEVLNEVVGCNEESLTCIMCEHCSLRDIRLNLLMDALEEDTQLEDDVLERVFADVTAQSRNGQLVTAERWAAAGLVPDGSTLEDLEMEVYDYLEALKQGSLAEHPKAGSENIVMLMGKCRYYLYDETAMTSAYAQWAFLAAEDDPLATFAFCVREDSRVYPRPMALESLTNPPFRMTRQQIEDLWHQTSENSDYADIQRVAASNGEVFFYSTEYLSPRYAASLAEWHAVERFANV